MNKIEFYTKISKTVGRPLTEFEQDMLDISCAKVNYKGIGAEFITIEDVPSRITQKSIGYWLYDIKSKTWLINLPLGCHTSLTGTLFNIYNNDEDGNIDNSSEQYVLKHYGFYVSGALNMYIPIKDEKYILSGDEKIFDSIRGQLKWRGI